MDNWEVSLIENLKQHNIELSDIQLNQFRMYADLLIEWNQKMNLTAIDDYEGIYLKHFYDCLLPSFNFDYSGNLCDVGAGAGFPSIVLKIVYPKLNVTIIEPLQKRCRFLNELVNTLNLTNVNIVNGRAEDIAKKQRESFDIVTARAVANLTVLSELCIPLVKKNGYFIAMKGSNGQEEATNGEYAIELLGCELTKVEVSTYENNERVNIFYKKIKNTPMKYPRNFGQIKNKPLRGK